MAHCVLIYTCMCVHRDRSIPSLDVVLNEDSREEYERMAAMVSRQIELETSTITQSPISPSQPLTPHHSQEPQHT